VLFVAIAIGGFIYAIIREKKRREAWAEIALPLGFTYSRDLSQLRSAETARFKLFSSGRSHRVQSVIRGENGGINIVLADYSYVTGSGKNATTHHQTVCLLQADTLALPHFYLRPEMKFFSFLQTLFSGKDINFDDDPEFSNMFILQGEDEDAIRKLFTPGVRRTLAMPDNKRLNIEGRGKALLIHDGSRMKVTPENAQARIALAFSLMNVLQEAQAKNA